MNSRTGSCMGALANQQVSVPVVPDIGNMGAMQSPQMGNAKAYPSRQSYRSVALSAASPGERNNYYGGATTQSVRPNALLLPSTSANSSSFASFSAYKSCNSQLVDSQLISCKPYKPLKVKRICVCESTKRMHHSLNKICLIYARCHLRSFDLVVDGA
uniref:Nuclear receptor domain-containing protein n=1 Tax=Ascaris lumbricoides TaxID=6252 RepID=A0A0M3I2P3_ASCLU